MTVPASCREFPPAAKLVCYALRRNGPLSYSALQNETKLPDSTLTDGITKLESAGRIEERPDGYRLTPNTGAKID